MEIDLGQLPIPDWGLICPQCRYRLTGLPAHRCPECGKWLEMAELVQTWTRLRDPRFSGDELPFPDFGLACAECGKPLAGAPSRACPACGKPFDSQALLPRREWFVVDQDLCAGVPLAGMEALLAAERVPYMRRNDKLWREVFLGPRVLGLRLAVPTEFYFEVLWLIRRAEVEMAQARQTAGRDAWQCPSCGEQVPGNFDVCWNCPARESEA